jgi:hypothetical protein
MNFNIKNQLDKLIQAVITKNAQKANEWSRTPEWLTIEEFFKEGGGKLELNFKSQYKI